MRRARFRILVLVVLVTASIGVSPGCMGRDPALDDPDVTFVPDSEVPLPPSLEPIVIPHPGVEGRGEFGGRVRDKCSVGEDDAGWAEKLQVAQGYVAGGYDDQARTLIRAALDQKPPAPWNERFAQLRDTLHVRRIETELLRVDARGSRDYFVFGTDVDWRIRIRNVSRGPLTFPIPKDLPGEPSSSAVNLSIRRRDIDIYGAELRRTWNHVVYLRQTTGGCAVTIGPGGIHEMPARLPAEDVGGAISGIRILEMRGTLRGRVREEDGEDHGLSLDLRPGRVVIVPAGYEPLARDPLGSLTRAVEAVAPTHLLVATEFVPRQQSTRALAILVGALAKGDPALSTAALGSLTLLRERNVGQPLAPFVEPLLAALDHHPERGNALMRGLTRITGQTIAPDARLWRDWWRRSSGEAIPVPASTTGEAG